MVLEKRFMVCTAVVALTAGTALPASAAPWTRGYVVGAYEYAFRYGGRAGYARAGEIEPGVDCPHGSTLHFSSSDQTKIAVARQKWRSQQEIDWISVPPGLEQARSPLGARFSIWDRAVAYRGYKRGIETYVNPWAADDPGQPEVTGRIADGFNLDGKIGPNDFVSPDGEKGIDNALYRAWGCDAPWRGNGNATLDMRANDKMQEGLYTMVIRVSGNQDPMNDSDATLEIGYSPDKIVKDARGDMWRRDFSYRIVKSAQIHKAESHDQKRRSGDRAGRGSAHPAHRLVLRPDRRCRFPPGQDPPEDCARWRNAKGLIGGYRNWRDLYAENTFAQDGGQQGIREHEDPVALYYALAAMPTACTTTRPASMTASRLFTASR